MAHAIEEPTYQVIRQFETFELREYAPYIVAEVTVPGPQEQAGNQGFRLLAGYIFGRNKGEQRLEMTAPVTQTAAPQKIAMTAPVTQAASKGGYVVQFMMPSAFTLDTLPEPLDSQVRLKSVPGGRFAVIRYSGTWTQANYETHLAQLREGVKATGLRTAGPPVYARYNAPWVPWFLRRNEIWLRAD